MEEERETTMGCSSVDLDFSFNSTASTSSFATTFASSSSSSARSSLSLSLPSFSASTSLINPLPHSKSSCSPHWSAIRAAANLSRDGNLHLRHLHLLRHLGSGHLAKVFHCRLKGSENIDFALKVVDLDALANKDAAASHVRTEARVLAALDHPFLPTLYARMDASHYVCFLIDYCPGGDLHSLLARQRLPISAVRFFAAEVLLALEYLHALGFVYRDLKPENVLIRSDGHIMLADFDLCFSSDMSPRLDRRQRRSRSCWFSSEIEELELVAEPDCAFSRSCVGTHEYLAPEMVIGKGHGNGVDWWAFGVFVYELLYGRTPFKGPSKEATLKNIMMMKRELIRFPDNSINEGAAARDLIRRLLVHDPVTERMGSRRGAAEIKKHPFFDGVNWPLMRCAKPPVAVGPTGAVVVKSAAAGWWSRMMMMIKWRSSLSISYKRGIKLGLVGCNTNKRKRKATKEKSRELIL